MGDTVAFGVIGCGLMGREFASASLRWLHLKGHIPRPRIVAACDTSPENLDWFRQNPDTKYFYRDYRDLLANPEVEAVYCAVPHFLHAEVYCAVLQAGKHLLGEKPFGMDAATYAQIETVMAEHPELLVRCTSEFPYYPGAQQLIRQVGEGRCGKLIHAHFSICHSSDLDLAKPINWKRTVAANGAYGCMGDLGMHVLHLPLRLGLRFASVSAVLSQLVMERPDPRSGLPRPCETWDNATLLCRGVDSDGHDYPITLEMKRMAPGCGNGVTYAIEGCDASARFTTEDANAVYTCVTGGQSQAWSRWSVGQRTLFPVITGGIFEFGFSDAMLQMYAAYLAELSGQPCPFPCVKPEEISACHRILSAALASQAEGRTVPL